MDSHMSKNLKDLEKLFTSSMKKYEDKLQKVSSVTPALHTDISALSKEFLEFKSFVCKALAGLKKQAELCSLGLDRHETAMRRNILLFHGVPETTDEKPLDVVLDVISSKLKLPDISTDAIQVCHRLGTARDKSRPLVVKIESSTELSRLVKLFPPTSSGTEEPVTPKAATVKAASNVPKRTRRLNEKLTDAEAGRSTDECPNEDPSPPEPRNGNPRIFQRCETVPDIKRDTSGITTQYIATGIVNLGAFAAGACIAWSSSALPILHPLRSDNTLANGTPNETAIINSTHSRLTLTEAEASWSASLLCLGAFCGAIPTGLISQYFGRKKTLLYLALPLLVSWLLVASSPNVYGLYVGRFVGGLAVGAFSVGIPPYVEDIAEAHLLSTLANFYHVHLACGVLFGYVVGMVSSIAWLSFLCASIPIAFFIAFIFLPESPAYFMSQGKYNEAKAALMYFRGIDNNIDSEIKEIKENMKNYSKHRVSFRQLLSTKVTVKALIVSFGLMIFQQMSGIYSILFYAQYIFNTFAISENMPGAAIILGFCLVSSTYFSTMLLKTVRRRVLLMISFAMMTLSLGSLAVYYHLLLSGMIESGTWIPLFTMCSFVSVYAAGVGPIPWLMLREIFPKAATRRATAITAGFHWLLAFVVTKMFHHLIKRVRPGWALWYFASVCVIGLIFVYFFVPETKGRTLEEIQNEFEGIHKKRKHRHVIEVESVSES